MKENEYNSSKLSSKKILNGKCAYISDNNCINILNDINIHNAQNKIVEYTYILKGNKNNTLNDISIEKSINRLEKYIISLSDEDPNLKISKYAFCKQSISKLKSIIFTIDEKEIVNKNIDKLFDEIIDCILLGKQDIFDNKLSQIKEILNK